MDTRPPEQERRGGAPPPTFKDHGWLSWPKWLQTRAVVDVETGCWLWLKTRDAAGYGRTTGGVAHRRVWVMMGRALMAGMVLHHRCQRRDCVNPDHLEAMERGEHIRGHQAERPHASPEDRRVMGAAAMRRWYARRKAEGGCRQCREPAVPGFQHCARHRERSNAARRVKRSIAR